jgi:hypothetical protein
MPKTVNVEIFVEGEKRSDEFRKVEQSARSLEGFLRSLDGIQSLPQNPDTSHSEITAMPFPLKLEVVLHNSEQASALGEILSGWVRLNVRKRVRLLGGGRAVEITHETNAADRDDLMRNLARM